MKNLISNPSPLSVEERLLILVNQARIQEKEIKEIKDCLSEEVCWDTFLNLAEINAVSVLTVQRLKELGIEEALRYQHLPIFEKAKASRDRSHAIMNTARNFLSKLANEKIPVVLLKGSMLGSEIYKDISYKKMNDIDILVRFEDVSSVIRTLEVEGFQSVGNLFGKKQVSRKSHHCPPVVSKDLKCVVGIHWGLHSPYSLWNSDISGIWSRIVPMRIMNTDAYRMSWEDQLLHLCFHLPFYKIGLRELADIFNLIKYSNPRGSSSTPQSGNLAGSSPFSSSLSSSIDWKIFEQRATEWKVIEPVYRALSLVNALADIDIPEQLLHRIEPRVSHFCIEDTKKRIQVKGLLLRSRSVHIAKIEKKFSIFQLSEKYSEKFMAWLGTWTLTLWPNEDEVYRLNASLKTNSIPQLIWYRIRTPRLIWNALARDHGQFALTLITSITFLKLVSKTIFYPFQAKSQLGLSPQARNLLEVLE